MEFSIDRADFLQGLALTQGVVERRNAMPILANVLLQAEQGLSISATDLEMHVRRRVRAEVVEPGAATVGARKFYEFARELKPGPVTVRSLENQFVEVISGRTRVKLVGLPATDFPGFPHTTGYETDLSIDAGVLVRMIDRTLFAASDDDTRRHLNGVFAAIVDEQLRFVGTDGHRLAMVEEPIKGSKLSLKGAILPRKGLAEVRKLLAESEGPARLGIGSNAACVEHGDVEILLRLVEGEFPSYEQVIPRDSRLRVAVEKDVLLSALRRVAVVASDRARGVKIELGPNRLQVSASSAEFGEASDEIEVSYDGGEIAVGFNSRYLIDVLSILPDSGRVELWLSDESSPGVVRAEDDESYRYVVMPMRL